MRWIRDLTGRFPERPHYDAAEIDRESEAILLAYFGPRYGEIPFPIPTDDLTCMIEQDAEVLDLYADLRDEGDDVEGLTTFQSGQKPKVAIAAALSEDSRRVHRLRTTIAHEYTHVRFHRFLYDLTPSLPLFPTGTPAESPKCRRESMLNAPTVDWMEWQAGYGCGAFLMPVSETRHLVRSATLDLDIYGAAAAASPAGVQLVRRMTLRFDVSAEAARVRLLKLGVLTDVSDENSPLMPA